MTVKEFCFKKKCVWRREVDYNKAFCMLPNCPYQETKMIKKGERPNSVKEIIQYNKEMGLIP